MGAGIVLDLLRYIVGDGSGNESVDLEAEDVVLQDVFQPPQNRNKRLRDLFPLFFVRLT